MGYDWPAFLCGAGLVGFIWLEVFLWRRELRLDKEETDAVMRRIAEDKRIDAQEEWRLRVRESEGRRRARAERSKW